MGGQTMTILDLMPIGVDMIETEVVCEECKGVGGFYFNDNDEEITRQEYLLNKHKQGYYMIVCNECRGQGTITIYEEIEEEDRFNEDKYYTDKYGC